MNGAQIRRRSSFIFSPSLSASSRRRAQTRAFPAASSHCPITSEHISMTTCVFLTCPDKVCVRARASHLPPAGSESTVMRGAPPGSAAACWSSSVSTEENGNLNDAFLSMRRAPAGVPLIYQQTPRRRGGVAPPPIGGAGGGAHPCLRTQDVAESCDTFR